MPSALRIRFARAIASSPIRLSRKPPAHHDALGIRPGLGLEEAPHDNGKLLRVILDRALDHGRGFRIAFFQNHIELGPIEIIRRRIAERIGAKLAQRLAPVFQNGVKRLAARTVAEEAFVVLELQIVAVDLDRRQARRPVVAECRRRDDVGHGKSLETRPTTWSGTQ